MQFSLTRDAKIMNEKQIMQNFDECIYLNKLGMIVLGIYPLKKDCSWFKIVGRNIRLGIVYCLLSLLLCAQWFDIYSLWGDVDANSETFLSNAFTFAVMMKITSFLKYTDTLKDVLQTMRRNWLQIMTKAESINKDLMCNTMLKARSRSNMYFILINATATLYISMPFLRISPSRERTYPFFGRYYFDRNSEIVYFVCFFIQMLTGFLTGLAIYVTDTLFLVCTYHFTAQLQILQNDFMKFGHDDYKDRHNSLKNLIKRHQMEIRNAQALQLMFSRSSLQQILLSCLMICANGFKLIISMSNRDVEFSLYLVCQILTVLQIFLYCQPGNELIIQSQALNDAIYQCTWYEMDQYLLKDLLFIIQRSQRPLQVIAGKLYVLSLENFMRIVKTAMSCLSVLRAMYQSTN